jgi:L-alanine-DL-glutamate epimerase-like enolase superfamily enzyme
MNLKYKKSDLPFKHPFTISKGTKTHQPALLVELEFFGIKGYGEAPAIAYYNIPVLPTKPADVFWFLLKW